jgi:hypothetical protein
MPAMMPKYSGAPNNQRPNTSHNIFYKHSFIDYEVFQLRFALHVTTLLNGN